MSWQLTTLSRCSEVLAKLVPTPSKPTVPVLVLTLIGDRTVWELAKLYGAYACFHKKHTRGEDLEKAIQQALGFVAQMPKEGRRKLYSLNPS